MSVVNPNKHWEVQSYGMIINKGEIMVNESENESRILIRSGGGKSLIIISENFNGDRWHTLNVYTPKFCPECGRKLEVLQ